MLVSCICTWVSPKTRSQFPKLTLAHSLNARARMRNSIESTLPMIERKWRSRDGLSYGMLPFCLCLNRLRSTIVWHHWDYKGKESTHRYSLKVQFQVNIILCHLLYTVYSLPKWLNYSTCKSFQLRVLTFYWRPNSLFRYVPPVLLIKQSCITACVVCFLFIASPIRSHDPTRNHVIKDPPPCFSVS